MAHVIKNETWAQIDIDTDAASIMVLERWKYNFIAGPGLPAWKADEERQFHVRVRNQVAAAWNYKIRLDVAGLAPFALKFKKAYLNFDIRRVTAAEHWTVNVRKMPKGSDPTTFISNVDRPLMQVNLDTADFDAYTPTNAAGKSHRFRAVPHEFGHTLPGIDDEYVAGAANLADTDSLMNIGDRIRERHIKPVLDALNTMIPNCTFRW